MQEALIKIQAVDSDNELVGKTGQVVNEKNEKKGSRKKDPYFLILAKAQKLFNEQIDISRCGLFGDCLRIVFNKYKAQQKSKAPEGFTERQFKSRFTKLVIDVLDRKSFEKQCKKRQVDSYVVATYLATMTVEKRQDVINGSWGEIPQMFLDCGVPIFEKEELEEYDAEGLLNEYTQQT